jgi:hypothetical protein
MHQPDRQRRPRLGSYGAGTLCCLKSREGLFMLFNDKRIAKRGHPRTRGWFPLDASWIVTSIDRNRGGENDAIRPTRSKKHLDDSEGQNRNPQPCRPPRGTEIGGERLPCMVRRSASRVRRMLVRLAFRPRATLSDRHSPRGPRGTQNDTRVARGAIPHRPTKRGCPIGNRRYPVLIVSREKHFICHVFRCRGREGPLTNVLRAIVAIYSPGDVATRSFRAARRGRRILFPACAARQPLFARIGRLHQGKAKFPIGRRRLLSLRRQRREPAIGLVGPFVPVGTAGSSSLLVPRFSFECQAPDRVGEDLAFSQEVSSSHANLEEGLRAGLFCGRACGLV